jgi:hypothetical protein
VAAQTTAPEPVRAAEVATVLNAIADPPPEGVSLDEQRLNEVRAFYPDLSVQPEPPAAAHLVH